MRVKGQSNTEKNWDRYGRDSVKLKACNSQSITLNIIGSEFKFSVIAVSGVARQYDVSILQG